MELRKHAAVERLDAAPLRWRELERDREVGEVEQGPTDALEAPFELGGVRRDRRRGLFAQAALRVAQQSPAVGRVRDAPGVDEPDRLVVLEAVVDHRGEHLVLIAVGQRAELVGERGPDATPGQLLLGDAGQPRSDLDPAGDPLELAAQQTRDGALAVAVLHQRAHHARLVQGCDRPDWRVGLQQQPLVLFDLPWRLEHDRHLIVALLAPGCQALEAVHDLVGVLVQRHDADGHRGRRVHPRSRRAWPQPGVALAQRRNRHEVHASRAAGGPVLTARHWISPASAAARSPLTDGCRCRGDALGQNGRSSSSALALRNTPSAEATASWRARRAPGTWWRA